MRELRLLLALEQYYILSMNPGNNSLKVAGGTSGGIAVADINRLKHSRPLFLYAENVLLYVFFSIYEGPNSAKKLLKVGSQTIA
jgi:hypothetical protein